VLIGSDTFSKVTGMLTVAISPKRSDSSLSLICAL